MPYVLDGSPSNTELAEAVNYLISNFSTSVSADPATGQVTGPTGEVTGYLYKYLYVKYADSFDGTLNFSDSPTNSLYYGVRNSDSSTESINPSDYVWTQVTGGFGTTKSLWYIITGGRQISFQVSIAKPNPGWVVDSGSAIDLDYATTASNTPANFVVIRTVNDSSAPTLAEVLASIGRDPIDGDLCTVNYNNGIYSIQYKYQSGGWGVFQKYITGDLIVANSIVANNIDSRGLSIKDLSGNIILAAGTPLNYTNITPSSDWLNSGITINSNGTLSGAGGGSVSLGGLGAGAFATLNQITTTNASTYIASAAIGSAQIGSVSAGSILAGTLGAGVVYAGSITAGQISTSSLSAISANLGSITAGSMNINNKFIVDSSGNATIQSGTSGARLLMQNNVIKVYDASGVLRVKIGDLSA